MPYLIAPMDPEPPDDYVAFVAGNLTVLLDEAARLVGGERNADEVYPEALSDVAGCWRRLRLLSRLGRRDATAECLRRRLAVRAKQWREEQIYPVDVHVVPPPVDRRPAVQGSLALRKAPLLPATTRAQARPVAEAAIAWEHAYRRHRWRRLGRLVATVVLAFGGTAQALSALHPQ